MKIRQPIVTVAGHVDHGKTSILDKIRGSYVQESEAGGITQKISFTSFPKEKLLSRCPLLKKQEAKVEIPGFLFIDTPGHAAFSNLRKRGGTLADLAILVIDINEGIKPQTAEVIEILKLNKTPFVIALNKIDNISGWLKRAENLKESIELQSVNAKQKFDEKLFTLQAAIYSHGFNADLFYDVKDFTSKIALVPCSARTGEGIQELLMILCGLSQRFLRTRLSLGKIAKGVILEIKKQKAMQYIEAVLYDGTISINNQIAIATFSEPIINKIRVLEEIQPLSNKFKSVYEATAATGVRMQLTSQEEILPGMPFQVFNNNLNKVKEEFKKEIVEKVQLDKEGIIIKADSLGTLEALILLLRQENVNIVKAGISSVNKSDLISAEANLEINPENAVILAFNVGIDEEVRINKNIKIIEGEVIYKLIENLKEFQQKKRDEIKREKLLTLATIGKIKVLSQYVFRNSKPAVFGVLVEAGKIIPGTKLINEQGEEIDKIKRIQSENKELKEASKGEEIAISLPSTSFDRQLTETEYLYTDINESQFREFKKNKSLLSSDEISVLQQISQIKRKTKTTWGV